LQASRLNACVQGIGWLDKKYQSLRCRIVLPKLHVQLLILRRIPLGHDNLRLHVVTLKICGHAHTIEGSKVVGSWHEVQRKDGRRPVDLDTRSFRLTSAEPESGPQRNIAMINPDVGGPWAGLRGAGKGKMRV